MHFHCNKVSKMTATGIKRTLMSVGRSHRHIRSRHMMTQSRAHTLVRAFAPRDQCILNAVTPTEPRTSVSTPHSLTFTLKYLIPCLFFLFIVCCLQFVVLKRRILLSISGCLFFGIIAVFIGCVALRIFRKPGLGFLHLQFLNVLYIDLVITNSFQLF